jgi:MFS family permease
VAQTKEFHSKSLQASFAAFVGLAVGPTVVIPGTLGLFVVSVTQEFGIGRGAFFSIMAVLAFVTAISAALGGRLMDRYGVRRVTIPGVAAFALAHVAVSQVGSVAMLVLAFAVMGLTCGAHNPVAYAKVVSGWFSRKRGMMLALTTALGAGAGAISAPMAKHFIDTGGWRAGYVALGVYIGVLGVTTLLFFLREPAGTPQKAAETEIRTEDLPGLSRGEALRTPAFWMVAGALFLAVGALVSINANVPALLQSRGVDIGGSFLAMAALGTMVGQVTSGFVIDRINSPRVAIPFTACALIGGAAVLHFGFSAPIILASGFVMGLGQGAEVGLAAYLVSRYCGLKNYGALYGITYAATAVAGGLAPVLAGFAFDAVGAYGPIIIGTDIALALSLLLIILLPPYRFAVAHHMVSPAEEALGAKEHA